jgi:hypothetical protein
MSKATSFSEYMSAVRSGELTEATPALHLMPTAGIKATTYKGKSDFDAAIAAKDLSSKSVKKSGSKTYHIANGRVHGTWDSDFGSGVVYNSSKVNEDQIDEISAGTLHSYSAKAYNQSKRLGPGVFDTDDSAAAKKFIAGKRQAGLSAARDKLSPTAKPTKDELHSQLTDLTSKFDPEYQQSDDHTHYTKHRDIAAKIADTKRQINAVDQKTTSKETIKAKPSSSVLNKVIDIKKKLAK